MTREEIIKYHKALCERREGVRNTQWKFNIAIWTLLALGISFLNKTMISPKGLIIPSLLFVFAHFLFVYLTQRALRAYTLIGDETLNNLDGSKDDFIVFPTRFIDKVPFTIWQWGWVTFQMLATIVLVMILFIKIW